MQCRLAWLADQGRLRMVKEEAEEGWKAWGSGGSWNLGSCRRKIGRNANVGVSVSNVVSCGDESTSVL